MDLKSDLMNLLFVDGYNKDWAPTGAKLFKQFGHTTESFGLFVRSYIDEQEVNRLMSWADFAICVNKYVAEQLCHMAIYWRKTIVINEGVALSRDDPLLISFFLKNPNLAQFRGN